MWLEAAEKLTDIAPGVTIQRGERILMEVSRKFTQDALCSLAFQSGFFWQVQLSARFKFCSHGIAYFREVLSWFTCNMCCSLLGSSGSRAVLIRIVLRPRL